MNTRTELINYLIKKNKYQTYLEIGVEAGNNLSQIICEKKVSVDPDYRTPALYHVTSDDFFKTNKQKFDIIFIDGLHIWSQVYKDIVNSLDCLNENGVIVCHDMNPYSEIIQRVPRVGQGIWTGDCWKAWVKLKSEQSDIFMFVIDMDFGCGVIKKGKQQKIWIPCAAEKMNYSYFDYDRKHLLNLISVEDFKNERYNYSKA
jgi:hypothetical protein